MRDSIPLHRYVRQMAFPDIGDEGQRRLLSSSAAVIGCGGLGTHIADNLTRAGVGRLKLVDRDYVQLDNLQRQILFDEEDADAALPKAEAAARRLVAVNSQVQIEPHVIEVSADNVEQLVADVDVVLDGSDNLDTRYLVNDACVKAGIPWVYGGAVASYGMTMTIVPQKTACLRCTFPEKPPPGCVDTCATAGILASVVAIVAALQCNESLKLLTKRGRLNEGLMHIDIWENSFEVFSLNRRDKECPACGQGRYEFLESG